MNSEQYKQAAGELTDYIANYLESIRERHVMPDVEPGYLRSLVPPEAPQKGEQWSAIFGDIDRVIMPGVTHWQSPYMHAYFPALNSYPSLLGDMLADAINCIGFTWASSPACTELEALVMDWLAKMIGLPDKFIHTLSKTAGGGIIQSTLSDATFVSILAARNNIIAQQVPPSLVNGDDDSNQATAGDCASNVGTNKGNNLPTEVFAKWRGEQAARLVAYCSDQAHSSVEKACFASLIELRILPSGDDFALNGKTLEEAVIEDIQRGKLPFYVCATLGTTGCCAFDRLEEIANVCEEYRLWLHVDAAYAGSTFICPEFQHFLKGINHAQSFAFNPSKYLMVHFDCTAMWVADSRLLHRTFNVDPLYLQHDKAGAAIDYMHWQIPLSRRFRALKLWFVIRSFGITGLQSHIRQGIERAKEFEQLVASDPRFEIPAKRHLGLTVFRLKGDNYQTERLLKAINKDRRLHCVPASLKGTYVIRFVVTSTHTTPEDVARDWSIIQNHAAEVINDRNYMELKMPPKAKEKEIKRLLSHGSIEIASHEDLLPCEGLSLLLSNVPESPKIINCTYAAIKTDAKVERFFAEMSHSGQWSPSHITNEAGLPSHGLMNGNVVQNNNNNNKLQVRGSGTVSACASPVMSRSQIAEKAKLKEEPRTKEAPAAMILSASPSGLSNNTASGSLASGSSAAASNSSSTRQRLRAEASVKAERIFTSLKTGFKSIGNNIAAISNKAKEKNNKK